MAEVTKPIMLDETGQRLADALETLNDNLSVAQGPKGDPGTTDHTQLTNRDAENQHPISAITGLQGALDSKATEAYVNNAITTAIGNIDNLIGSGVIA